MKRNCLECGIEISGRIDKKFCSDQCRNTYNNKQNSDGNKYVRHVNYQLRKNRRILEALLDKSEKDVIKVNRKTLIDEGFDFNYFTNILTTKQKKYYYFNYEYGFLSLDDGYFAIVKNEDFMK
jgi:predicted nucleic acid-binding Zn ribbon protein